LSGYYNIAVLPGDGIGPEVTNEAIKVLRSTGLGFKFTFGDIGSRAYNDIGNPIPDETKRICEEADAVYLGAIGHSYAPYNIPELVTRFLRIEKEAYVNLCHLKSHPGIIPKNEEDSPRIIDIILVRSNLEGFVITHEGDLWGDIGRDVRIISRDGATKVARYALEHSKKMNRKKITCIDAHNLLYGDKLFRSAFSEVAEECPEVNKEYLSVNVASMMLAMKPENFDVIITHGIFGEILTWHIIGQIGGIGMAPQASIGNKFAVFQPVGGAAWQIAGKGIANPIGAILAGKLLLEWLGEEEKAKIVDYAVGKVIEEEKIRTPDLGGTNSTSEVGDSIIEKIQAHALCV
jgi:isocitrate/isopropylmalate dehydrogenase